MFTRREKEMITFASGFILIITVICGSYMGLEVNKLTSNCQFFMNCTQTEIKTNDDQKCITELIINNNTFVNVQNNQTCSDDIFCLLCDGRVMTSRAYFDEKHMHIDNLYCPIRCLIMINILCSLTIIVALFRLYNH